MALVLVIYININLKYFYLYFTILEIFMLYVLEKIKVCCVGKSNFSKPHFLISTYESYYLKSLKYFKVSIE